MVACASRSAVSSADSTSATEIPTWARSPVYRFARWVMSKHIRDMSTVTEIQEAIGKWPK